MKRTKKIWKQGDSYVVTIPKDIIDYFHLKKNDLVEIDIQPLRVLGMKGDGEEKTEVQQ